MVQKKNHHVCNWFCYKVFWTNTLGCDMYTNPFWSNERRDLGFCKNSLEKVFPCDCIEKWLRSLPPAWGWAWLPLYTSVIHTNAGHIAQQNISDPDGLYQRLLLGGYDYTAFQAWSPQFVLTPFLASRTEVCSQRILWWVLVGFSDCTWSSRLEKKKVAKTLQQNKK